MPTQFVDKEFTFVQPDGTELKVRGSGNQYSATFTTLDGYTVIQDPVTKCYQYAKHDDLGCCVPSGVVAGDSDGARRLNLAPGIKPEEGPGSMAPHVSMGVPETPCRWHERREENRRRKLAAAVVDGPALAPPGSATVGSFVGLCLPISFPDVPPPVSREEIDDYCNKPGYTGFGNNGSVHDYFHEMSNGALDYTNVVAPWYEARRPKDFYANTNLPVGIRAQELIREALAHHKAQGFDFSQLTADASGCIYAINIFYAGDIGPRSNPEGTNTGGLWPHAWAMRTPILLAPGRVARDYQVTNLKEVLELGTFCHENGHMLCEFPDLYDRDYDSSTIGHFCLMAAGNHADQKNPVQVGAYLKHTAGWTKAIDLAMVAPGTEVTLRPGSKDIAIFRRSPTEYFLFEARLKQGRDAALPGAGLAIWKIDELGNNDHQWGSKDRHYECALMQADGELDLENGRNQGDEGDLYKAGDEFSDTTRPNSRWWDGTPSGLRVHNIRIEGDTITFST